MCCTSSAWHRTTVRGRDVGDGQRDRGERLSKRLAVGEGESIGVIGRNSAGKSAPLKILSRITEPTAGVARMGGRVAAPLDAGTGFHPELTGRESVHLNGAILGMSRRHISRGFEDITFAGVEREGRTVLFVSHNPRHF